MLVKIIFDLGCSSIPAQTNHASCEQQFRDFFVCLESTQGYRHLGSGKIKCHQSNYLLNFPAAWKYAHVFYFKGFCCSSFKTIQGKSKNYNRLASGTISRQGWTN